MTTWTSAGNTTPAVATTPFQSNGEASATELNCLREIADRLKKHAGPGYIESMVTPTSKPWFVVLHADLVSLAVALPKLIARSEQADRMEEEFFEQGALASELNRKLAAAEARADRLEAALRRAFSVSDPSKSGPSATKLGEVRVIIRAALSPESKEGRDD